MFSVWCPIFLALLMERYCRFLSGFLLTFGKTQQISDFLCPLFWSFLVLAIHLAIWSYFKPWMVVAVCILQICSFSKLIFKIFYFMDINVLPACMDACGGQKRASKPLELELETFVGCMWVLAQLPWTGSPGPVLLQWGQLWSRGHVLPGGDQMWKRKPQLSHPGDAGSIRPWGGQQWRRGNHTWFFAIATNVSNHWTISPDFKLILTILGP